MATEYEFRLVTKVTQGSSEDGFMHNEVADYVVLGHWIDTDPDTETATPTLEELTEEAAEEAQDKEDRRVNVMIEIDEDTMAGANSLNMRYSMDSSINNVIAVIPNGTILVAYMVPDEDNWLETSYDDKTGYIQINVNGVKCVRNLDTDPVKDEEEDTSSSSGTDDDDGHGDIGG